MNIMCVVILGAGLMVCVSQMPRVLGDFWQDVKEIYNIK